jgi:hypothetical protein
VLRGVGPLPGAVATDQVDPAIHEEVKSAGSHILSDGGLEVVEALGMQLQGHGRFLFAGSLFDQQES